MAAPTVQAVGAQAEGTGAVTPTPPTHQVDDILVVYAEHAENAALTTGTAGWAAVADSPVIQTLTRDTTLDVFWKRATGSGTAGPTLNDPGNHIISVCLIIRGCITTGNPWDVTAASLDNTADTSGSITGDTTTVDECLILNAVSAGVDVANTTAHHSAWADGSLVGVTERFDVGRTVGNGGSLGIASGIKSTAGAYGPMTVTLAAAAVKAMHTVALKPPPSGPNEVTASIPLALAVAPVAAIEHESTASIPLALAVAPAVAIEHESTAGVPLAVALAPVASAPAPEVTASISLGLALVGTTATEHEATSDIPLAVALAPVVSEPLAGVTAAFPLTLGLAGVTQADHAAATAIPLALDLAGVTQAGHAAAAEIPLALGLVATGATLHAASATIPLALALPPLAGTDHQVVGEVPLGLALGPAAVIDPSNLTPPPAERTVAVLAENRTITVGLEGRTVRVLAEGRTVTVGSEDRTVRVLREEQTITVEG